jgi:lysophospholipase L1-like esterase
MEPEVQNYATSGCGSLRSGEARLLAECFDDSETWPFLLMKNLNEAVDGEAAVWVTNSGLNGLHSEHHVMHAKYLLPTLPRIDYMIVYAGTNDVGYWLRHDDLDPHYLDSPPKWNGRVGESFCESSFVSPTEDWFRHFELWKLGTKAKARLATWRTLEGSTKENGAIVRDTRVRWLERKQLKRKNRRKVKIPAAKRATLPAALDSYAANLRSIIDIARQQGTEPIFMSQAVLGRALSPDERKRLWMGAVDGGKAYVFHTERLDILEQYNDRMRNVAEAHGVLFLDLPSHLNTLKKAFYDDCHLNEYGCRETARFVAQRIRPHLQRLSHADENLKRH